MPSPRLARLTLVVSIFVMGGCGLVYEYVLSVLGNYLIGSSHEEIFIIIGLMLFAMGVGSFLQRHLDRHLVDRFLTIEVVLGLLGGFAASTVHAVYAISESYRIVLYAFAFAIGALIGMEIPVLIRINERYAASLRTNLSEILSMDYVGALAGALLFTYVLLTRVTLAHTSLLLGATNVILGLIGLLVFRAHVHRPRLLAASGVLTLGLLGWGALRAHDWSAWAEQRSFRDPIVLRDTSPYQHIVLTRRGERVNLYLNGHLQFSSVDEAIYHEHLVHPALTLAPGAARRVLILGGGDGLALREVLRHPDVAAATLVELDPRVIELARTHPELVRLNEGALSDVRVSIGSAPVTAGEPFDVSMPVEHATARLTGEEHHLARVHVAVVDADRFLENAPGTYDVALLDFPDPSRIELAKLYSVDFYRRLAVHLRTDALVAVQSTSPYHARQVFLCIGETLRAAGFSAVPYHANVPSFGEWGFHIATPGAGREEELRARLRSIEALPVPTRHLTPELIAAATHFGRGWLDATGIEPNHKLDPVILRYFREAWRHY